MDQRKPSGKPTGSTPRPAGKPAIKPAAKSTQPQPPGDGLLGWFGRQVGHVSKAVKADVTKPAGKRSPTGKAGATPAPTEPAAHPQAAARPKSPPPPSDPARPATAAAQPAGASAASSEKVIYRNDKVELAELPDQPGVILRRTIIDEVVIETTVVEPGRGGDEDRR